MKAFAVALAVVCVSIVGADPADAAAGTKVFLKDCTLQLSSSAFRPDSPEYFFASDSGSECGEYQIRGVSIVTESGRYAFSGLDSDDSLTHEDFAVRPDRPESMAYGTVDVYIPYRSRCDRYRLYANSAVRLVDSRPCSDQPTVTENDIVGGYRVSTLSGLRSVRTSFEVTSGTCDGGESLARHGLRLSSHGAYFEHFCDSHGSLHYRAFAVAAGLGSVVQRRAAVGDQIRVSITISPTTATATVRNVTKGWTQTKSGSVGPDGFLSPARIGTFHYPADPPLTQFAPVVFANVTIGGYPLGQWANTRVILTDSEGTVQVRPSAITNGKRFTNTWKHR